MEQEAKRKAKGEQRPTPSEALGVKQPEQKEEVKQKPTSKKKK